MAEIHQEECKIFANKIAELCFEKYRELPRTGKPSANEWTLLSGIIKVENWVPNSQCSMDNIHMEIVSLGTGSKCIGRSKLSARGDLVNDSHAEIMARRGFLRYLYRQMYVHYSTKSSDVLCCSDNGKCALKSNVTFHMFSSHLPCGDGSIFPKEVAFSEDYGCCLSEQNSDDKGSQKNNGSSGLIGRALLQGKRKDCDDMAGIYESKRIKVVHKDCGDDLSGIDVGQVSKDKGIFHISVPSEDLPIDFSEGVEIKDIHRTGAKCLAAESQQDPHLPGRQYHVVGVLRTKPGRGDPTLSLSCSDKLARWNIVGVQGALISLLLSAPIYLNSIVIGGGCPFSYTALHRAAIGRFFNHVHEALQLPYATNTPLLLQATEPFPDARSNNRQNPCPSSLVWCKVPDRPVEIAVNGKKQGVTKKASETPKGRLLICKKELLKQFVNIVNTICKGELPVPFPLPPNVQRLSYLQWKTLAKDYYHSWNEAKRISFPAWPRKTDNLLFFTADEQDESVKTKDESTSCVPAR